eukprot:3520-Heterococcus_DN1.PRE.2
MRACTKYFRAVHLQLRFAPDAHTVAEHYMAFMLSVATVAQCMTAAQGTLSTVRMLTSAVMWHKFTILKFQFSADTYYTVLLLLSYTAAVADSKTARGASLLLNTISSLVHY